MKKTLLLLVICAIITQWSFAQVASWAQQSSGLTSVLNGIYFSDNFNGCAVGDAGKIIYTNNGGNTWNAGVSGTTKQLNSVCFTNNMEGWVAGNSGAILHSTNGGLTWVEQVSGTTQHLKSITFVNDSTGWVVGAFGTTFYTSNKGVTWTSKSIGTAQDANNIYFVNDSTGWVAANMGKIVYTNNYGVNWTLQTTNINQNLLGICFVDLNNGWAVGSTGAILHTNNGGVNWDPQATGLYPTYSFTSVYFTDSLNGWALGSTMSANIILHTTNGGAIWTTVTSPATLPLKNIYFLNENNGWIVGNNGMILNRKAHEEICLVTVDSAAQKNLIMWDRIPGQGTDYYKIYKLTGGAYDSIGYVPFGNMSTYIDNFSVPQVHADKYKISAVDILGNESALSPFHQTINLLVGVGVPASTIILSWNYYVDESAEFVPDYYRIYRGVDGVNFELHDSIAGTGAPSYNDINISSPYYYKIAVFKQDACFPSSDSKAMSGPFSQSISNVDENIMSQAINNISNNYLLNIYPNPFSTSTTIAIPNEPSSKLKLRLVDLTGKTVFEMKNISGNKIEINRGDLKSGVYFIELLGDKTYRGKLVVE